MAKIKGYKAESVVYDEAGNLENNFTVDGFYRRMRNSMYRKHIAKTFSCDTEKLVLPGLIKRSLKNESNNI